MKYIHKCNDLTFDLDLTSEVLGGAMDPTVIRNVKCFTRKNGRLYSCSFSDNTLIANGNRVTVVLNNHGLEAGILQYVVELQIPDTTYPDGFKKIHQFYVSDIELVTGNGEQMEADIEALYGTTIDEKINAMDAQIDSFQDDIDDINSSLGSVKAKNTIQDTSINHIEDVLSTIDGGTSETIERLDTSVNALQSDVSTLNASVNDLQAQTDNNATGLTGLTNTVNDVSTRVNDVETVLGRKADTSVLGNYYTKDETYNKDEVDLAIANAALDGSLPEGIVIDNNYVHTDNNYTTEDKNKVRDFDLSLYPTNSSLSANYATKAELQNVDDSHPTNASVSGNYIKKNEIDNYLTDYPTNASVSDNYAKKTDLNDYPTNTSVSDNYVHWLYANENYVSYENIDEIIFNTIDNNYDIQYKIDEVVTNSSTITDISTNVSDVSVKVIDVSLKTHDISTRLDRDYLTTLDIQRDYITNASVSANYTTKDEFNEVWTTGFLTQDSADELYAKTTDISTFITENDASVYLTDYDFGQHSWGAISLKNTEVVNKQSLGADVSNYMFEPLAFRTLSDYLGENYAKKNDISTFKSIVFISQNDYDTLVSNDEVDANTVYMINGQPVTYLTANDVSIYATKEEVSNDISTFITSNDASVYATTTYVDAQIGNIQNILSTI